MYFVQSTFGSDNTKDVCLCTHIYVYNRKTQTKLLAVVTSGCVLEGGWLEWW